MAKEMLEQKEGEDVNIFKIVDNGNPGDILQQQANGDKLFVDPLTVDVLPQDGNPGDILQLDLAGDDQWVDPLTVETLPDGDEHDVLTIDDTAAKVFEPIPIRHFLPVWIPGEYFKGTLTVDEGWTMLSNALTSDRPAPDAIGDPQLGFDNTEIYLEDSNLSRVTSGHIYNFTLNGWIQRLRVRVPEIDPDISYRFTVVNEDTGTTVIIDQTDQLIANEWVDISIGSIIVTAGTTLRVFIDALNSIASTTVLGPWVKVIDEPTPGDAPPADESWNLTTGPPTLLNINKQDATITDRTGDLLTFTAGTEIVFTDQATGDFVASYTIDGAGTDEGDHFSFPYTDFAGTMPDDTACDMVATIPINSLTSFIFVEDHWTVQPDYAVITGFLEFNGAPENRPLDGFGIDLQFQEAFVSPDWNFIAGGGVIVSPVFVVSSDDTLVGLGIDSDRLGVAQPFTDDDRIKLDGIEDEAIATVTTDTSLNGLGTVASELQLNAQTDASLTGVGTGGDPLTLAIQSDASLTGVGSVASPLSVTPVLAQYGEIFAATNLVQIIPLAGAIVGFDADGVSQGITPDFATDSLTVSEDGNYDIFFQGSSDEENDVSFTISIRINGVDIRSIGQLSISAQNNEFAAFGFGATLPLLADDIITIFVVPAVDNENFNMFIGARLHAIKLS